MASYTNPSSTYLTSATNFQGVPISQLLAALGAPEPSSTFAAPPVVQHNFGLRGIRGSKPDPRNRPRPRATTQTTAQTTQTAPAPAPTTATSSLVDPVSTRGLKGAALQNAYAQNRAAMRARRQQEAQDLEAIKATNRARLKQEALDRPKKEAERALAKSDAALARNLREPDRGYDKAEAARLAPRTPSSVYTAPAATPVSNRYQEVEGMLGDMEARQAAQGLDALYREAAIQSKYGTDAEMLAERNRLAAEQEVLNRNADRAQMGVDLLHAQQNAARRAEAEAQYQAALAEPTDMQRLGGAVSRAFSPEGLSALYRVGADPISQLYRKAFPRGPIFVR